MDANWLTKLANYSSILTLSVLDPLLSNSGSHDPEIAAKGRLRRLQWHLLRLSSFAGRHGTGMLGIDVINGRSPLITANSEQLGVDSLCFPNSTCTDARKLASLSFLLSLLITLLLKVASAGTPLYNYMIYMDIYI